MGIDVHLYHYSHDHDSRSFVPVPEEEGGYIRESYFRNDHYATKVLFSEAWSGQYHLQPKPGELYDRLSKAIEENHLRYMEMRTEVIAGNKKFGETTTADIQGYEKEAEDNIRAFVARYRKEYEDGYDPFVTVSY